MRDDKYIIVIELLERYSNIDNDIREYKNSLLLLEEIHNDNIGKDLTSPLQQAVVMTSNKSDKTAAAAIRYISEIENLKRKISNAIYFKMYVYQVYSKLSRWHKKVFKNVYMTEYRLSNEKVGDKLNCSYKTVAKHLVLIHEVYYNSNIIDYLELI